MSIPSNSPWRGCAAIYPQPLAQDEQLKAQSLVETIHYLNCQLLNPPLANIIYRNSTGDSDISRRVFRWDRAHYEDVFRDGFIVWRQQDTPDNVFYNLEHYLKNNGGRLLGNTELPNTNAMISTTVNGGWHPSVQLPPNQDRLVVEAWRYEVYAPGGIMMAQTLERYQQVASQDEVCFVAGIAPQYIRSAQRFRLVVSRGSRVTRRERVDNVLFINTNFNPQSHPQRLINIQRPITHYIDETGQRVSLTITKCQSRNDKSTNTNTNTNTTPTVIAWYTEGVTKLEGYIDGAFRSSRSNEAYLFMKNEYLLLDYAPGTNNDKLLNGPMLIRDGFPSLKGTPFGEYGIDSAFVMSNRTNESFIFSGKLCARINFAPGTTQDHVMEGPILITTKFPFFRNTVFEDGVDAAFESSTTNEAYLFKGDSYALINFAPGTTDDFLMGGVKKIVPNWPSLQSILPRLNFGIDLQADNNEAMPETIKTCD